MSILSVSGKKILLVGLGVLGGGVSTARWLIKHGAKVTITDLRDEKTLTKSIAALGAYRKKIKFVLGEHREEDFTSADLIVANQAVSPKNKYLTIAREHGVPIEDDLTIFLSECTNPIIAITGTRGKTTTTAWLAHFLNVFPAGNSSDTSLLKLLGKIENGKPAVVELSSFQLEYADATKKAPDISIITNLYRDHINRHGSMREYAKSKTNIFRSQTEKQNLILNADDEWTPFFLRTKTKGVLWFTSVVALPKKQNGLYIHRGAVTFRDILGKTRTILSPTETQRFETQFGKHNLKNLLAAMLGAHLSGLPWKNIRPRIKTLPTIPYRQEVICKKKNITIINDSAGTSPEATIAALERFKKTDILLITGGTDKNLTYGGDWEQAVRKIVHPENLFLLNGSATKKMLGALKKSHYFKKAEPQVFESLEEIIRSIKIRDQRKKPTKQTVLFSPGAASFEKFKNEFDRGEKFTLYSKQLSA